MILTYRYRLKDNAARDFERKARAVNLIWNYCCDVQRQAMKWQRRWPTWVDLSALCSGSGSELGLHSDTVTAICRQFARSRALARRCPRFRASGGSRRALGWVPVRGRSLRFDGAAFVHLKRRYPLWLSRPVDGEMGDGSISQDARGRWYLNVTVDVAELTSPCEGEVGIDLGLKTLATCSDGQTVPALRHYRRHELALGKAQRANSKRRVKAIHAKIANSRRHHLHVESTRLVRANRRIVVGNVSASKLAKTNMAKSVLDAGWSSFRTMLRYKAIRHGVEYIEADESFSSRACSDCGSVSGPKGIAQLGIRQWACPDCGAAHDRDVNAARNILRAGSKCRLPAEEIADGARALIIQNTGGNPPILQTGKES